MIFFDRFSSSTTFSTWQPKNARQTLGDKLVCIWNLQHYPIQHRCSLSSRVNLGKCSSGDTFTGLLLVDLQNRIIVVKKSRSGQHITDNQSRKPRVFSIPQGWRSACSLS